MRVAVEYHGSVTRRIANIKTHEPARWECIITALVENKLVAVGLTLEPEKQR